MEAANSVNDLIMELVPTVKKVAKTVRWKNHSKIKNRLDMEAQALLFLVQLVNEHFDSGIEDWKAFASRSVINHLVNYMEYSDLRQHEELPSELLGDEPCEDILQDILDCCEYDLERQVIILRGDGHTVEYIVKTLRISMGTVNNILTKVKLRYEGVLG
jgi:hypothetical protein